MGKLIFYNLWHNGDIHFTRSYIRDIMKKTNFDEYQYLHNNNPGILRDIPNLVYGKTNEYCQDTTIVLRVNNDLYINVWIGFYNSLFNEEVDSPVRTVSGVLYRFFTHIYEKLGIKLGDERDYVPFIEFDSFDKTKIDTFIETNKYPKVLVVNGPVFAYQSVIEINFMDIINRLSEDYPYVQFLLTERIALDKPNVLFTSDIAPELMDISYLSMFCDVIFGRSTGPYVFSWMEKNLKDTQKTYICASLKLRHITWGTKSNCKNVWIEDYNEIYNIVKDELKFLSPITVNDFTIRCVVDRIYVKPNIDITPEHDVSFYFYTGDRKNWEHKNYVALAGMESWYIPYHGYNCEHNRIKMEFRTAKNLLFFLDL